MQEPNRDLEELEKLVEENRRAFERAKRLLEEIRKRERQPQDEQSGNLEDSARQP